MSSAGWWPDPLGRHEMRYHDGSRWTQHVSDHGAVSVDAIATTPLPTPEAASPTPMPAPSEPLSAMPPPSQPMRAPAAETPSVSPFAPPGSPFGAPPEPGSQVPFGAAPVPPTPLIQEAGTSKKLMWFVVALLAIALIAAAVIAVATQGDDSEGEVAGTETTVVTTASIAGTEVPPSPAPTTAAPSTEALPTTAPPATTAIPATTPPTASAPPDTPSDGVPDGGAGPVPVGTTVRADGSLVRVNRVTPNSPGDEFFQPEPGNTITEIEVEACAGPEGFSSNSFYWSAFLADNTAADNFLFGDDLAALTLNPGGCTRGVVTFEVPEGQAVTSVVLTDPIFSEIARWNTEGAVEVGERLAPETQPEAVPVGTRVTFGADHSATVQTVQDAAPPLDDFFPPDAGHQYNRIDLEMCAGAEQLSVNGLTWYGVGTEHWTGTAVLLGDTLPVIELAAGECVAGAVQIEMPEGTTTAYVLYVEPGSGEIARWSVG